LYPNKILVRQSVLRICKANEIHDAVCHYGLPSSEYTGWSDVTVTYDLYVVGQHGVLREVKWRRFVVLFK